MKKVKVGFTFQFLLLPDKVKRKDLKTSIISIVNFVLVSERKSLDVINFLFCDDNTIIDFNKKYLKHDFETDIITFLYEDTVFSESDIIISLETVKRNSLTYKSSYLIELFRVIIHGLLHLCGMKDDTKNKRTVMRNKENNYLKLAGLIN
ncbi:MAG: rRNA maturation RNase YbeY [Ignavibacteria bacterium]